jgi:hypothetical protein
MIHPRSIVTKPILDKRLHVIIIYDKDRVHYKNAFSIPRSKKFASSSYHPLAPGNLDQVGWHRAEKEVKTLKDHF